jgi:ABC-type nitrate/sulfonate/bicarbonate transport system substrate-binding protein
MIKLWYTRCPVPTASGIAFQKNLYEQTFAGTDFEVHNIKELGKEQANTHFSHSLPYSFREGGGSPPIWAYAQGAKTKLLAITFMEEVLGIYVRADDPAQSITDLAGRKLALPVWPKLIFNFFRFAAEKAFYSALAAHGMSETEIHYVDVIEDDDPHQLINPAFAEQKEIPKRKSYYSGQLHALLDKTVDAIFAKGAEVVALEEEAEGKIRRLYDVRQAPELWMRVNNSMPRLFTVDESLALDHPEAVVLYLQTAIKAARWALANPDDGIHAIAAECGIAPAVITACFEENFLQKLMPEINNTWVEATEVMKNFLAERGYISRNFDLQEWLDPSFLQEAMAREKQ